MFTLKELEKHSNGKIINGNPSTEIFKYSAYKTHHEKGEFYIPFVFKNLDREIFILNSVKEQGIGFMINKSSLNYNKIIKEALEINPEVCILEVESVNEAIYGVAIQVRKNNIEKPIVAVTGSVGKTMLCNLISSILKTEKNLLHDFKNENNNTSLHIAIDFMELDNYDMAVIELGTSDNGRMHMLSKLVQPSIAVISKIGTAHLNKLKSKEGILNEKIHITDFIKDRKLLFVNSDDEYLKKVKSTDTYEVIKYSENEAKGISGNESLLSFKTNIYNRETEFNLNLYGRHNVANVIVAIKIAEIYNISYDNIIKGINSFKSINRRFNILENKEKEIKVIDDTYSSSFESAKLGLEIANKIKSKRKIAVLGKMAAYGEQAPKMHEELGTLFKDLDFDYLYLNGEFTKYIFRGALNSLEEKRIKKFKTKELLVEELEGNIENGDLIYVKAANTQNYNEIIEHLKNRHDLV